MVDLIADKPFQGLPLSIGCASVEGMDPGPVTAIQPFPGATLPIPFPQAGQVLAQGGGRLVWAGRETAFLMGEAAPDLAGLAGVTDQTDGWAWARLSGPDMAAVLARLCPLDLRALPVGTSARTMLTHLPAIVIRTAPETLEIGVFRSMAGTLEHELSAAMRAVAARASLR